MEGGEVEKNALNTRDFSRVIITLDNVLLPDEKFTPTPSILDGLDSETEADLRILGCELIQTSGILLRLPQVRTFVDSFQYLKFSSGRVELSWLWSKITRS